MPASQIPQRILTKLGPEELELLESLLTRGKIQPESEVGLGWGPWKFWVRGINLITFLFMTYIAISLLIYWDFKIETMQAHQKLTEQNEEMVFLQSLTEEQRRVLGLKMPESLARRLYRQEQEKQLLERGYRNEPKPH